ncbi:MAG: lytic transglycosylase domain-containing protein [Pseudorhodoplanes sp.]|nr:lytic transglycosylase domain-containing protein [Pseudorhodoplanes sp.]
MHRKLIGHLLAATALAVLGSPALAAPRAEPQAAAKPLPKPAPKQAAPKAKAAPPRQIAATVPMPRPRPAAAATVTVASAMPPAFAPTPIQPPPAAFAQPPVRHAAVTPPKQSPLAPTAATSPADLAAVKQAIDLVRKGKNSAATEVMRSVGDPVARKVIEWAVLRAEDDDFNFERYAAFIATNPGWPSVMQFRRKAEAALWQNPSSDAQVRNFFAAQKPVSAKGKLALARTALAQGDRALAQQLVRDTWRNDSFSADVEKRALDAFGALLSAGDHKARLDNLLYAEDMDDAMRAAQRLGASQVALAKARAAVAKKASNAKALLDAVPRDARNDAAFIFTMAQWLRRNDKIAEAAQWMLKAPTSPAAIHDLEEWWTERRLLARKLLDIGEPQAAFRISAAAALPEKEHPRVEALFTSGWIALRFLNNPAAAMPYFAKIMQGAEHPASISRSHYWQGRAAETMGRRDEARRHYERGAQYPTAYYGQLARARLGPGEIRMPPPPHAAPNGARLEIVRAIEILYAIDERDLVVSAVADLADKTTDIAALAAVAALTEKNKDPRAMVLLGRTAVGRGLPFEAYAYPIAGLPRYNPVGPQVEPHIAYAIARQESGFNPRAVSSANALGLMQVTPAAGKYIAKKNGISFDQKRLLNDPVYNVQMGAAELGDVIEAYRGSYILAFVAYNAGRGRVREWSERYGDPRDPKVDPVDWVERIPFSETRNYVQRVMENMQIYRVRFGGSPRLMIEADLRRGMSGN